MSELKGAVIGAICLVILWAVLIKVFGIESQCCNPYDMAQYECKE